MKLWNPGSLFSSIAVGRRQETREERAWFPGRTSKYKPNDKRWGPFPFKEFLIVMSQERVFSKKNAFSVSKLSGKSSRRFIRS